MSEFRVWCNAYVTVEEYICATIPRQDPTRMSIGTLPKTNERVATIIGDAGLTGDFPTKDRKMLFTAISQTLHTAGYDVDCRCWRIIQWVSDCEQYRLLRGRIDNEKNCWMIKRHRPDTDSFSLLPNIVTSDYTATPTHRFLTRSVAVRWARSIDAEELQAPPSMNYWAINTASSPEASAAAVSS